MKINALLVVVGFGPTYKKRLLNNLKTNKGYEKYDVLLITNDIEYWDELKNKEKLVVNLPDIKLLGQSKRLR